MTIETLDDLRYRERGGIWSPLPRWVRYFIDLGAHTRSQGGEPAVILVSTPCESPAAALAALGAMLERLTEDSANDIDGHFDRLCQMASRRSPPAIRKVGERGEWRPVLERETKLWMTFVSEGKRKGEKHLVLEHHVAKWHVEGEAPVSVSATGALPNATLFTRLVSSGKAVLPENLRTTDSAIVLVGRPSGKRSARRLLEEVEFRFQEESGSLAELSTICWAENRMTSRLNFCNVRTGAGGDEGEATRCRLDRDGAMPALVSLDDPDALSAVLHDPVFERSSILAIVPRTLDREKAETLANAVSRIRQRNIDEADVARRLPAPPPGVVAGLLRREV